MNEEVYQEVLKAGLERKRTLPELGNWWRATSFQEYKTLAKRLLDQAWQIHTQGGQTTLDDLYHQLHEQTFRSVAKDPIKSRQWLNGAKENKDEASTADILRYTNDVGVLEQAHEDWQTERITLILAAHPNVSAGLITSLSHELTDQKTLLDTPIRENALAHLNQDMNYKFLKRHDLLELLEKAAVEQETFDSLAKNWEGSFRELVEAARELSENGA